MECFDGYLKVNMGNGNALKEKEPSVSNSLNAGTNAIIRFVWHSDKLEQIDRIRGNENSNNTNIAPNEHFSGRCAH